MPINYDKIPIEDMKALLEQDYNNVSMDTLKKIMQENIGKKKSESAKPDNSDIGSLQEFAIGAGKGAENIVLGAKQRLAQAGSFLGLTSPELAKKYQEQAAENDRVFATLSEGQPKTVSRSYLDKGEWKTQESQLGNPAKMGEIAGEMGMLSPLPGGSTGGFVRRGLTAAASGSVAGLLQPTKEGESSLKNAAVGAVAGGATSAALSGMGKLYNAVATKAPENEVTKLSEKYGIRASLGEILDNPIVKKMETWLEAVPLIGLKGFRKKQNQEAVQAASDHFAQYVVDPASAQGTTAAMKVANNMHLDDLYDTVRKNAKILPMVEATELKPATVELLDRFPDVFNSVQDTKIKKILTNIKGDVETKTVDTGLVSPSGKPLTKKEVPTFSFDDLWELRKGIGKEIQDSRTDTAKGILKKVYSAVSDDLDTLLSQSKTPVLEQFKAANEAFKQYSVKFDVLRQAYDKATGTTGAGEMFSPKTYSTALKNLANDPNYKKNVKWSPEEIENMTGLANILQVTKRAGQFAENPPTGNRWGVPMVAAEVTGYLAKGTVGGVAATGAMIGGTALASFLTGTKIGQNLVRVASKVEPNSQAMKRIVDVIYNQMPKVAAVEGTQE
jgi:hypothetical protein